MKRSTRPGSTLFCHNEAVPIVDIFCTILTIFDNYGGWFNWYLVNYLKYLDKFSSLCFGTILAKVDKEVILRFPVLNGKRQSSSRINPSNPWKQCTKTRAGDKP
jgi:hypothetical protein